MFLFSTDKTTLKSLFLTPGEDPPPATLTDSYKANWTCGNKTSPTSSAVSFLRLTSALGGRQLGLRPRSALLPETTALLQHLSPNQQPAGSQPHSPSLHQEATQLTATFMRTLERTLWSKKLDNVN